jgi:hypothetical protein
VPRRSGSTAGRRVASSATSHGGKEVPHKKGAAQLSGPSRVCIERAPHETVRVAEYVPLWSWQVMEPGAVIGVVFWHTATGWSVPFVTVTE